MSLRTVDNFHVSLQSIQQHYACALILIGICNIFVVDQKMQLKHIIAFLLTFITLSMEVVSHLMDENDEHQLQFLVRVDANKDERISYKELIDAKIEQVK